MTDVAFVGEVSTEGGPLLLADWSAVASWTGTDGDDYDHLCRTFDDGEADSVQIDEPGVQALAWDVPTGTTEIWRLGPNSIILCRIWLDEMAHDGRDLASLPFSGTAGPGSLSVVSGWFAVFWATATGGDVVSASPADGQQLDLVVGGDGLIVALERGDYECLADEVTIAAGLARRCLIRPVAKSARPE